MRNITDHQSNVLNDSLEIIADDRGLGGASHDYTIKLSSLGSGAGRSAYTLSFQKGGVAEAGVNGISNEALIAIVIDRLQGFQSGAYKCRETAVALTKLEEALMWMHKRTQNRTARGVEGTHQI